MENDGVVSDMYRLLTHLYESGKIILRYLIERECRQLYNEHVNGHPMDPDGCIICRYDREVIGPREMQRARDALNARVAERRSAKTMRDEIERNSERRTGYDEVDRPKTQTCLPGPRNCCPSDDDMDHSTLFH